MDTYRIITTLKVETDIIVSIAASLIGRAVILVIIMSVQTFKKDLIVFIDIKHHNATSH